MEDPSSISLEANDKVYENTVNPLADLTPDMTNDERFKSL
jgi:hypothetical protein